MGFALDVLQSWSFHIPAFIIISECRLIEFAYLEVVADDFSFSGIFDQKQ